MLKFLEKHKNEHKLNQMHKLKDFSFEMEDPRTQTQKLTIKSTIEGGRT